MKALISLLLTFSTLPVLMGQGNFAVEKLEKSKVPAGVIIGFDETFPGVSVVRWEKHTTQSNGNTFVKYVVIFDQDGIRSRARYRPDGSGISASSYYLFKRLEKLPSPVREYAANNYKGYILGSGEKITSLKSSKYVYRIRLRKGANRIVVYLNEKGELLMIKDLASEFIEDEDINGND